MLYNLNLLMSCIQPLWNMSPCNKIYFIYPGSKFLHTAEPVLEIVPIAVSALPGVSSPARLIFPALCKPVRVTAVHPGEHKIYFFHSYSPAL